tara:strand:+ start:134 stop:772 length:639 start_codon:yes stop_codon:yes gene_type:complete
LNNQIKVIDDFLDPTIFSALGSALMTSPIYTPEASMVNAAEEDDGSATQFGEPIIAGKLKREMQFVAMPFLHLAVQNRTLTNHMWQDLDYEWNVLKNALQADRFWKVKANAHACEDDHYTSTYHIDLTNFDGSPFLPEKAKRFYTAILYINTNNGGTRFKECQTFIQSKANRVVIFPVNLYHATVWHTDAKLRFVLNINYEIKPESDTEESN